MTPANQENLDKIDFRKTRLYELLAQLKPKQRQNLVSVVELPLFKLKKEALSLLNETIKHIDKKKAPLLKSELMAATGIDKKKFNYIVSDLFKKLCRALFSLNILADQDQVTSLILANFFFDNDFPINSEYAIRDIETTLNKEDSRTHDFHYYKMKYHQFKVEQGKDTRIHDKHLDLSEKHFDAFYAENKLRFLCEAINRNKIINAPSMTISINTEHLYFTTRLEKNHFFNSSSVEGYYLIYQMLLTRTEESYQKTLDKINSGNNSFGLRLEQTLLEYLMNQCIYFINKNINRRLYANNYLDHAILLDKKNILLVNDKISPGIFQSIILVGLMTERKEWVSSFIKDKAKKLNTPHEEFIVLLHFALIDFRLNDIVGAYNKIEKIIKPTKGADPFFIIFFYKLTIQIYYTLNRVLDRDLDVEGKIDSFRQYLYRQKTIATEKKKMLLNFVSFISRINALKPSLKKKNKLKEELLSKKSTTAYSDWLETLI